MKKNLRILGLFVFVLMISLSILIWSCAEDDFLEDSKNKNNDSTSLEDGDSSQEPITAKPILAVDEEIRIQTTNEDGELGIGGMSFDIYHDVMIVEKRNPNNEERQLLDQLHTFLKQRRGLEINENMREQKLAREVIIGYKNSYYDKAKTEIAYKDIYHKTVYYRKKIFKDGSHQLEHFTEKEWEHQRKENNNPNVLFSVSGSGTGQTEGADNYCLVSVTFEEGTAYYKHSATLYIEELGNQYSSVANAVKGISGSITLGQVSPMSFADGIDIGRIKLLEGEVVEKQDYSETATEQNIPVYINGDTVTLRFYTEDENDYDYNDSFVTVVVSNINTTITDNNNIITVSNNTVTWNYNSEAQSILNNQPLSDLEVHYRHGSIGLWIPLSSTAISGSNLILNNIPNYDITTTEFLFQ